MNLSDELSDYYNSVPDNLTEQELNKLEMKTDAYKHGILEFIISNHQKNFGFPDVALIKKAIKAVPEVVSTTKRLYWKVCNVCKEKYDYNLSHCPVCWKNGKNVDRYAVGTGESFPQVMHRLNICTPTWTLYSSKNCYSCGDGHYCMHFGRADFNCNRQDFDYCGCRNCCVILKKMNTENQKKLDEHRRKLVEYEMN